MEYMDHFLSSVIFLGGVLGGTWVFYFVAGYVRILFLSWIFSGLLDGTYFVAGYVRSYP